MIDLDHVTKFHKKYTTPHSIRNIILHQKQYMGGLRSEEQLCIIENLTTSIGAGEITCIVGGNGAGKSTLAKIIAQTIKPTSGCVKVNGLVVPFLELGVAFNSELSGRDNAILNGVLLGMSQKQVRAYMEDIFEYAGITDFIDTPLKYYSSGMLMRLAFSIGMHADGDIYIFDEILAVGDQSFQAKCFAAFEELLHKKKTIILITHDLHMVSKYATRVLLLRQGHYREVIDHEKIKTVGEKSLEDTISEYFKEADCEIKTC